VCHGGRRRSRLPTSWGSSELVVETDPELLAIFVLDVPGRLTRIELQLETLERARGPSQRAAAVAAATNEAHSLSGAAATVRLPSVARHAERMELALRDDELGAGGPALATDVRDQLEAIARIVAELEVEDAPAPAPGLSGRIRRMVLHIEDNPVNMKLIERALARRPEVGLLTATHAETGIRIASAARPDLILLDLNLPDASGQDFLSRLRADPATCDIPVVVVTAHPPARSGDSLRRLGIREYLTKPIDIGRLLELVDELAPTVAGRADGSRRQP
jgi:CheY-like chemotaxis protein